MEFEKLFSDAVAYARETFAGHWVRWLIFVVFGLPFALVRFVLDPAKIVTGTTIHWDLIPWGPLAALGIAGFLTSFIISGYVVRIYRGVKPAPDFAGWGSLFADGIKLTVVIFVWFLPSTILFLLLLLIALGGIYWPGFFANYGSVLAILLANILLAIAAFAAFVIAILYMFPGGVRFARTGSTAEGWGFSAITGIIRKIGWLNYIVALVLYFVASIVYTVLISLPNVIPYVGWLFPLCLAPFLTVFSARYFMVIYETGETPPPVPHGAQE